MYQHRPDVLSIVNIGFLKGFKCLYHHPSFFILSREFGMFLKYLHNLKSEVIENNKGRPLAQCKVTTTTLSNNKHVQKAIRSSSSYFIRLFVAWPKSSTDHNNACKLSKTVMVTHFAILSPTRQYNPN